MVLRRDLRSTVALLLAACMAGGCTSLGERIAQPHSTDLFDGDLFEQFKQGAGIVSSRMRTPEGVEIAYEVIPAAEQELQFEFSRDDESANFSMRFKREGKAVPMAERGTVVFLHGWGLDANSMLPWALALSERGWRGIAMDLRNHGRSSRAPAGYGTREAGDVVALLEHLQAQGELHPPVYLFGVSYGAATALFAEPALRGRIAGIVAMESYANAGEAIVHMVSEMLDDPGDGLLAHVRHAYTSWRYDAQDIERGVDEAGRALELDLHAVDVRETLAATHTCTLLLHGAADRYIPVSAARSLATASPLVRYRELPDENHISLPVRIDWLAQPIADWLQAADDSCPELQLPPDPLEAPGQTVASGTVSDRAAN